MDARTEILERVLQEMQAIISSQELNQLDQVLCRILNEYEVQPRSTEITIHDGSAEGLLRKFLAKAEFCESELRIYDKEHPDRVLFICILIK